MGRNCKKEEEKKIRQSITLSPDLVKQVKEKHINLSSLVNKLLQNFFQND